MEYEMLNMCCIEHVLELLDNQMSEIKFVALWWFAVAFPSQHSPQLIQNKSKNFNHSLPPLFNAVAVSAKTVNKQKIVVCDN